MLEIGKQNITRKLVLLQAGKVIERLFARGREIAAGRLLFDKQLSLPEHVQKAALALGQVDAELKARDTAARNTE